MASSKVEKKTTEYDPKEITVLACAEIFADTAWNSRVDLGEATIDESTGYLGLVENIDKNGQQVPIFIRVNPAGKGRPYTVIAGFRRYAAICELAAKHGNKRPTIDCILKVGISEAGARMLNVAENTLRAGLNYTDLAFGIHEIFKADMNLTQSAIAEGLGKNQGHVGDLLNIMTKVDPELTEHWRHASNKLTKKQMLALTKMQDNPSEQKVAYYKLVTEASAKAASSSEGEGEGSSPPVTGPGAWESSHLAKAKEQGAYLARLQKGGFITVKGPWNEAMVRALFKVNAKATPELIAGFATQAKQAYDLELTAVDVVPDTPVVAAGKGKGAKNGAVAPRA